MSQYIEIQKKIPLHQFILEKAPYNKNVAIYDSITNEKLCYHQIPSKVFHFGKNLQRLLEFKKGTSVAIILPKEYSLAVHLIINLGICCVGGHSSFLDPTTVEDFRHVNHQLKLVKATTLICQDSTVNVNILKDTGITQVIYMSYFTSESVNLDIFPNIKFYRLESFLKPSVEKQSEKPEPIKVGFDIFKDIYCLPFNARNVKCVKFSHSNIIHNLLQLKSVNEITSKDVILINYPFFHIFTSMIMFLSILNGAKVVTMSKYTTPDFFAKVSKLKVTKCYLHIESIIDLYSHIRKSSDMNKDLPTLKSITCLGPRCSTIIQRDLSERMKLDIKNCYGYVETLFLSVQKEDVINYTTSFNLVGKLLPGTRCRIINSKQDLLQIGSIGDIAIYGPQCGHYYQEKQYKWYKTGDVGKIDQKNQLYVIDQIVNKISLSVSQNVTVTSSVGRKENNGKKKTVLAKKSKSFYANELKDLLLQHQDIVDAEVVNESGLIKGYVRKAPGSTVNEIEMIEYVVGALRGANEEFKIINQIEFVAKIKRDVAGYVKKNLLKRKREINKI